MRFRRIHSGRAKKCGLVNFLPHPRWVVWAKALRLQCLAWGTKIVSTPPASEWIRRPECGVGRGFRCCTAAAGAMSVTGSSEGTHKVRRDHLRVPLLPGFSLVEVIVAVVILSIGILAMAGTTNYIFTRSRGSGVEMERAIVVRQVLERLRASAYADVVDRDAAEALAIGGFRVWWEVRQSTPTLKQVVVVSEGPGYVSGKWMAMARDTVVVNLADPRS